MNNEWESLCAQWVNMYPSCLPTGSEDSDQIEMMPRVVQSLLVMHGHIVDILMSRLSRV